MEPIVEVSLPLRSECKCFCHNGGFTHVAPCCRNDPTPSPDLKADNAALVEALERIRDMPGPGMRYLKGCGELPISENEHMAQIAEEALAALQATEPRP